MPPEPQRRELSESTTTTELLIYYEAMLQKYEAWADEVNEIIKVYNSSGNTSEKK